jgi:threonine dehydratase
VTPPSVTPPSVIAPSVIAPSVTLPTVADVREARDALRGRVVRTPVLRAGELDVLVGGPAAAKAECLQHTGSFKLRGALNRVRTLSREALDAGLITVSAGNAALGAAYAAREFGARLTVVMPENAVPEKLRAVRSHGATVISDGITNATVAFEVAEALLAERGCTFLHPFDDPMVVAGAATATLEFLEDEPELDRILMPCSGGGLIAGAVLAARAMGSPVEIIGVQPEGADGIVRSLASGTPTPPPAIATVADGLTAPKPGRLNLELIRSAQLRVLTVSDEMILAAMGRIVRALRVLVEPAAAVGLAALLDQPSLAGSGRTGLMLSGSNVSMTLLAGVLSELPGHRPVVAQEGPGRPVVGQGGQANDDRDRALVGQLQRAPVLVEVGSHVARRGRVHLDRGLRQLGRVEQGDGVERGLGRVVAE